MRLLILFFISFVLISNAQSNKPKYPTLEIGAQAPDFKLKGVDGKMHSLGDYKAKVLAIVFNCNHCPTAQAYEDRIIQLVNDYKDKDFQLIMVSSADPESVRLNEMGYTVVDDGYEAMVQRSKTKKYNFPYLYDGENQKCSMAYGPTVTPHLFVFDADRKLQYHGRIDNDELGKNITKNDGRNAIDAVLAGKKVEVPVTRAKGCSTKWAYKRDAVKEYNQKWLEKEVTLAELDASGIKKLIKNDSEKVKIINIWATTCGACVAEMPDLVKINRQFETRGVELITISADNVSLKKRALKVLQSVNCAVTDRIEKTLAKEGRTTNNFIAKVKDQDEFFDAIDPKWNGSLPYTMVIAPGGKLIYSINDEIDVTELKTKLVDYLGNTYK
ncbi:MAG: redoxin domain-containing protein [Lentisphaeraceae bacterium]|nr:redoxin domain-containing protein [Lentisphaeraceae bacterium]